MSIGGPHEVLPSHGRLCFLQLDVQARAALAGGCGHARPPCNRRWVRPGCARPARIPGRCLAKPQWRRDVTMDDGTQE